MNNNSKLLAQINQLFHNKGIKQEARFDALMELMVANNANSKNAAVAKDDIAALLNTLDYNNKDLIQELFMLLGSKFTKFKLDQFYTPLTISEFICNLMMVDKDSSSSSTTYNAIDPAGGTGDLLLYYKGAKTIWDIDANALKLCKFNYELNKQTKYELVCKDSLAEFDAATQANSFSYVAINPPFGSSTLITDKNILDKFELGQGRKKQEIGILFIELGLKLLKPDGIMFVIVPSGYTGNTNKNCLELRQLLLRHRVIASIELPRNTFKRSGTGVNTYLLMIQKVSSATATITAYNIFISQVENIGYNLSKKETPLKYKLVKSTGAVMCNEHQQPILDNDFKQIALTFNRFCLENAIPNVKKMDILGDVLGHDAANRCSVVRSDALVNTILDIKRYTKEYLNTVHKLQALHATTVTALAKIVKTSMKIESDQHYKYLDISSIQSPFYSGKEMYGWELPSRAKYALKKYDILISKLEGTMSYCVILDNDTQHYISTNGVTILRPNNMTALYILLANVIQKDFIIQHNAFLTGSIMASLTDADIGDFLINKTVDIEGTKKILETLETLHALRA